MNHQHHLKSDPKFGRFGRFSRGGGARGGARVMPRALRIAMMVVLGVMPRVMRIAMMVCVRPRSQGLRGFVWPSFRVAVPGVSGVSNPGLLIWLKALDMGGTCETC